MFAAVRLTLRSLTRAERRIYLTLLGARVFSGVLDVVGIGLVALVMAVASQGVGRSDSTVSLSIAGFSVPELDNEQVLWLVVAVLLVFTLKAAFSTALIWIQSRFVARVEAQNAVRITDFVLTGSLENAKRFSKSDLQFALTGSATFAYTGLLNNLSSIVTESFLLGLISVAFVLIDPWAALCATIYFGLVVVLIQGVIGRSLKKAATDAAEGTVDSMRGLSDSLDTFREISVLERQRFFIDDIARSRQRMARGNAAMNFFGSMPRYVVETSLILGVAILVIQQVVTQPSSEGFVTVGVFLAGGVRMMASLIPLQNALANLKQNSIQAMPALAAIGFASTTDPTAKREGGASRDAEEVVTARAPLGPLGLRLDHVSYRHPGADTDTIRDVSLTVEPGQLVAIVGPSGAGKTTLADLILGLLIPDVGNLTVGGLEPRVLRKLVPGVVAYVPQKPGLVSGSIAENIALGVQRDQINVELLAEVIDAAHLRGFLDVRPGGSGASVGKSMEALSGGQVQRIGVARALYSRSRLLVLDEATSGLDAESEAAVLATIRQLHGDVTVVVIAHRMSTIQHADLVVVVEDGQLKAVGDFESAMSTIPMVHEYVKLQSLDK